MLKSSVFGTFSPDENKVVSSANNMLVIESKQNKKKVFFQ